MDSGTLLLLLLACFVLAALFVAFRHHFSPEARAARRRARNYRQIATRKPGPAVKLAVDLTDRKPRKK